MTGHEFEQYCANYLKKLGYTNVQVTPSSGDKGADILATKNGLRYAFQCKYYDGNVGNKAVQEVYAAKAYYGCDRCAVMTNSQFTRSAIDSAKRLGVVLWDSIPVYGGTNRLSKNESVTSDDFDLLIKIILFPFVFPFKILAWMMGLGRKKRR